MAGIAPGPASVLRSQGCLPLGPSDTCVGRRGCTLRERRLSLPATSRTNREHGGGAPIQHGRQMECHFGTWRCHFAEPWSPTAAVLMVSVQAHEASPRVSHSAAPLVPQQEPPRHARSLSRVSEMMPWRLAGGLQIAATRPPDSHLSYTAGGHRPTRRWFRSLRHHYRLIHRFQRIRFRVIHPVDSFSPLCRLCADADFDFVP